MADASRTKRAGPQLVAPAGSADAAYAALACGADAVYAGLGRFSARAEAPNLSLEELDELVGYAHSLVPPRRVFVALNTLVLDNELDEVVETLARLEALGVDAVLVQDLGVARIVRAHFPSIRLHASTQMAVHGRAGVETLARMGFARVILARELTLDEIRRCAGVPGIEVEVFVHGALCYSHSGLCMFSSQELGRSGNRGRCAQPCRAAFMVERPDGERASAFPFSMKDLGLGDRVAPLAEAGVAALKIEGRMRGPLYVAAATDLYRRLIDECSGAGRFPPGERARAEEDLRTIFSRPWTDLYIGGRGRECVTDPRVAGHRGARIGEAEAVVMRVGERRAFLRFRTSRRLELHDGLQIEPAGLDRPFGFPVERMRLVVSTRRRRAKDVFEAPAGSTVEVGLPAEYPLIPPGTPVCCSSSQEVKQRFRWSRPAPGRSRARRPADFGVELSPRGVAVAARAEPFPGGDPVEARVEVPGELARAKEPAKTEAAVRAAFERLGGTPFALRALEVGNPDGLFAPASTLNAARREAAAALADALDRAWAERVENVKRAIAPRAAAPGERGRAEFLWSVKTDRLAHVAAFEADDWRGVEEVTVDVSREPLAELEAGLGRLAGELGPGRVRLALPVVTRAWEEADIRARVARLRGAGWPRWEVSNLSGWTFLGLDPRAPGGGVDLAADWPLYVTNREAARALAGAGAARFALSPEDGLENWRALLAGFGDRAVAIVHQDTPLFISETPVNATRLLSSFGQRLVAVEAGSRTVVLDEGPLCFSEHLDDLARAGAVRLRADFVWREYAPLEARDRWRAVRSGAAVPRARTANFLRGLA